MDSDLIVLPREAVAELRGDIQGAYDAAQYFETHATCSGLLDRFDALLAAANPVVDCGVMSVNEYLTDDDDETLLLGEGWPKEVYGKRVRVLLIAADAAEEGE